MTPTLTVIKRPRFITMLALIAVLGGLSAVLDGVSGLMLTKNQAAETILLTACFNGALAIADWVTAWGLWKTQNWARVSFMALVLLNGLLLPFNLGSLVKQPGFLIFSLLVGWTLRGAVIYWLVVKRDAFQPTITSG